MILMTSKKLRIGNKPLINYYSGNVVNINGSQAIENVKNDIIKKLT